MKITRIELEERKIRFMEANMKFEGFCINEKSRAVCRQILKKEVSGDEIVKSCILKYKKSSCDE